MAIQRVLIQIESWPHIKYQVPPKDLQLRSNQTVLLLKAKLSVWLLNLK